MLIDSVRCAAFSLFAASLLAAAPLPAKTESLPLTLQALCQTDDNTGPASTACIQPVSVQSLDHALSTSVQKVDICKFVPMPGCDSGICTRFPHDCSNDD